MKRLLIFIATFLCLTAHVCLAECNDACKEPIQLARMGYYTGAGGPSCATTKDACAGNEDAGATLAANATSGRYKASMFVADADTTICAVSLRLKKVLSPTFNMTVEIWSNNDVGADNPVAYTDDLPNTLIGTGSAAIAASSVGTDAYETVLFTGMSATITSGTIYWVVLKASAAGDATNHILWGVEATGCAGDNEEVATYSTATTLWTKEGSTTAGEFQAYAQ